MKLITINNIERYNGYFSIPYIFIVPLPEKFLNKINKQEIAKSYNSAYDIVNIDGQEWFQITGSLNLSDSTSILEIKSTLEVMYNISKTKLSDFQLKEFDDIIGLSFDGTKWS